MRISFINNKKTYIVAIIILLSCFFISACKREKTPITGSGLYFDTLISITLYENNSSKLIESCFEIADRYEKLFSKTIEDSDVSRLNNSNMTWVKVDKETYRLVSDSIKFEDISDGHFSIMCGALTDLWDVSSASPAIPTNEQITSAIKLCGKDCLDLDEKTCSLRINKKGAKLDLGAVAKGYIADQMKEYLLSQGVDSGIIQLGGNVLVIGENKAKENGAYVIGISEPFSESGKVITSVNAIDQSIVTSGNYQRYFEKDGKIYHHIIDLATGYPADSGLNSVTIICNSSFEADALSTICFLYGKDKALDTLNRLSEKTGNKYDAIFISNENIIIE